MTPKSKIPPSKNSHKARQIPAEKEQEAHEMKVSKLFLETLFDGIHEEIMVIDKDFAIRDVNRVFLQNYGLRKEEVLGRKCHAVAYGNDTPCGADNKLCPLENARKTGKRVEVTHYRETPGGQPKELIRIMYPVATSGKLPEYFVEISRDVTEYRGLIRKLQASEKNLRSILDTATDAILSIDEDHRIILFNNAAQRIFGYPREEVLGKDLNILIPSQYGDHHKYVKRFLKTKAPRIIGQTLALTALRNGGEEFPVELGLSYHEMEGHTTFTAIIRDVSQQRLMEKTLLQSERLAAVGQAVAHVAHEIKNPLMVIGGLSHQIKKGLSDQGGTAKLDMILEEVVRLEKLVENVGDFTREYKLVKRSADVNSVIRDVLRIMAEIHPRDRYTFKAELAPDLNELICDPDKLKQVFINVITNGIEAMENGGTITVRTDPWAGDGVEIQIGDEGIGMSEEDLFRIFEPFYTTRKRGSGLGLSISYKIVEAHDGEIWALSLPGEGTTFVIRIPGT
jgi:two-component system sensor kinase FixL